VFPLVTVTLFLPLAGCLLVAALPHASPRVAHTVGIATSGLTLLGALAIWQRGVGPGFTQVEGVTWIASLGAAYRVGVDGLSFPLVLLTTVLFLAALVFSAKVTDRARAYVALFLLMETACLGVFLALDMVLFYVFFEVTLVGMYFTVIASCRSWVRGRTLLLFDDRSSQRRTHGRRFDCSDLRHD